MSMSVDLRLLKLLVFLPALAACPAQLGENNEGGPTGILSGIICAADGTPDPDATIAIESETGFVVEVFVATSGRWRLWDAELGTSIVHVTQGATQRQLFGTVVEGESTEIVDALCDATVALPGDGDGDGDNPGDGDGDGDNPGDGDGDGDGNPAGVGSIAGCICNSKIGAWAADAEIRIDLPDGSTLETTSDDEGCFQLDNVPAGMQIVRATASSSVLAFQVAVIADELVQIEGPETCALPEACLVEALITPESTTARTDIIIVVDSSGSMNAENQAVQDNLNAFSQSISASGIDHRVVLIGSTNAIMVPPPLGGSEDFLHLDMEVDSETPLVDLLAAFPLYQSFLRPDSRKHILVVSDDDSEVSAANFVTNLIALPGQTFGSDWVMHAVVAYGSVPVIGCWGGANEGNVYMDIVEDTGGILASICDDDFSTVFDAIETVVQASAALPCTFALPEVPEGFAHDLDNVSVIYEASTGLTTELGVVDGPTACQEFEWYLTQSDGINVVNACPGACDVLRNSGDGQIQIEASCYDAPPGD